MLKKIIFFFCGQGFRLWIWTQMKSRKWWMRGSYYNSALRLYQKVAVAFPTMLITSIRCFCQSGSSDTSRKHVPSLSILAYTSPSLAFYLCLLKFSFLHDSEYYTAIISPENYNSPSISDKGLSQLFFPSSFPSSFSSTKDFSSKAGRCKGKSQAFGSTNLPSLWPWLLTHLLSASHAPTRKMGSVFGRDGDWSSYQL